MNLIIIEEIQRNFKLLLVTVDMLMGKVQITEHLFLALFVEEMVFMVLVMLKAQQEVEDLEPEVERYLETVIHYLVRVVMVQY